MWREQFGRRRHAPRRLIAPADPDLQFLIAAIDVFNVHGSLISLRLGASGEQVRKYPTNAQRAEKIAIRRPLDIAPEETVSVPVRKRFICVRKRIVALHTSR